MKFLMMSAAAISLLMPLASAQDLAPEPSEERKIWALKRAYELNGNSMVGMGSIDLSQENPGDEHKSALPGFEQSNALDNVGDVVTRPKADVCARHGLRKIEINGGKSWRCRK